MLQSMGLQRVRHDLVNNFNNNLIFQKLRLSGERSTTSAKQMIPLQWQKEREEELKSLPMRVKKDRENAGLKLNIQKTKIMASGPITSWQIGKKWKQWHIFSSWVADSDCSHEIKRCLLLGRKAMTNLDRILKSRDITLSTKVCLMKAMVFPVVM